MSDSVNIGIILKQKAKSLYKEIFRKLIHLCSAFVPFFLSLYYWPVIFLLCFVLILYCISESFRLKGKSFPIIGKITEIAARKRDENKFVLGPVTLVIGIICAALLNILCNSIANEC